MRFFHIARQLKFLKVSHTFVPPQWIYTLTSVINTKLGSVVTRIPGIINKEKKHFKATPPFYSKVNKMILFQNEGVISRFYIDGMVHVISPSYNLLLILPKAFKILVDCI